MRYKPSCLLQRATRRGGSRRAEANTGMLDAIRWQHGLFQRSYSHGGCISDRRVRRRLHGCQRFRIFVLVPAFDRDQCQGLPRAPSVSAMKAPRVVRAINIIAILLAGFLLAPSHAASGESGNIWDVVDANALTQQGIELEKQGRYSEAIPLAQRALALYEKALDHDDPRVATALGNLAELYRKQGHYADAEPLYKRSLAIQEKALGSDHHDVAASLHNLAVLYQTEGRYADAERLSKRSLAILEKAVGPDNPEFAIALSGLASLYQAQQRYADAEPLYKRSLAIQQKILGTDHPNVAATLNGLARLYHAEGRYADAEPLYKHSLTVNEKVLGPNHPAIAVSLNDLAWLYASTGRYADALPLVRRAAQMGFPDQPTYLGVLLGAVERSLIPFNDAFDEGYQLFQQTTSSAASKAVNQLAIRFAAGDDRLAEIPRGRGFRA
jgi:tetratricopeptide repeat protein